MSTPNLEEIRKKIEQVVAKCNKNQSWLIDNCIFMHLGGSFLYGTNTPQSDIDVRGVVIAPKDHWVGANEFDHFEYQDDEIDIALWDIRKFIKSVARVSPNVVETLFVNPGNSDITILVRDAWFIRDKITALLNKSAYMAYYGYSKAQLHKMIIKHGNKTGRQELVEEYGFDTKFAAHGFRLVRQGKELLETGKITFPRPDAQELLDIRMGKIYRDIDMGKCAQDLQNEQDSLGKSLHNSILPEKADFESYNNLLMNIYDNYVK